MNEHDKMQKMCDKIRGHSLNRLRDRIIDEGADVYRILYLIGKDEYRLMSFSERCEYLNKLRLTYADLRFAPEFFLKSHLGLKMLDVLHFGFHMVRLTGKTDFFTETIFHISKVKDGVVTDFGFFIDQKNDDNLSKAINEPVIDADSENFSLPEGYQHFCIDPAYHKSSGFGWFEPYCHETKRIVRTRLGWSIYKLQ